jgi:hypothetical protein
MCFKLVIKTNLYYDARSEKHQIVIYHYQNPIIFRKDLPNNMKILWRNLVNK